MAQEPCLDMAILLVLVPAVLVLGGQTTVCEEWMIANPPIIFGKTAELLVFAFVTPNNSSNTHSLTSWLGGKNYSVLTFNGGTIDPRKYKEIQRWQGSKLESILQIYKFDEMDVNVNYSCSIGDCQNRKKLLLTPDKFEYHPDKDTTRVLTNFRNGYLDVVVKIIKVYPIPKCTIIFNENIISQRLKTKKSVNGIFYMVVEKVDQRYFGVCNSQLNVTCVVGKTEIPIYQKAFNTCTKTKEESPEHSNSLIIYISAGLLLFIICAIGMGCLVKSGKLKKVLCCHVRRRGKERLSDRRLVEMLHRMIQQHQAGATHDTGQEESHEMMSPSSWRQ